MLDLDGGGGDDDDGEDRYDPQRRWIQYEASPNRHSSLILRPSTAEAAVIPGRRGERGGRGDDGDGGGGGLGDPAGDGGGRLGSAVSLRRWWKATPACLICGRCDAPRKSCGGCLLNMYCSTECQTRDWASHRAFCKKLRAAPLTASAVRLVFSCNDDALLRDISRGLARAVLRVNDRDGTWSPGTRRYPKMLVAHDSQTTGDYAAIFGVGRESPDSPAVSTVAEEFASNNSLDPSDVVVERVTVSEATVEEFRRGAGAEPGLIADVARVMRKIIRGEWIAVPYARDSLERAPRGCDSLWPQVLRTLDDVCGVRGVEEDVLDSSAMLFVSKTSTDMSVELFVMTGPAEPVDRGLTEWIARSFLEVNGDEDA